MLDSSLPYVQNILVGVLVLVTSGNASACGMDKSKMPDKSSQTSRRATKKVVALSQEERKRVDEAADRFIRRFRETLDFGVVFDEMGASNAIQVLRDGNFFRSINISPQLVAKLDEA